MTIQLVLISMFEASLPIPLNSFMTGAVIMKKQWTGFYMITASVMKELKWPSFRFLAKFVRKAFYLADIS